MAVPKRRITEIRRYSSTAQERPHTSIDEIEYKNMYSCKYNTFDTISFRNFFFEYNWDANKKRLLHKETRIKSSKFINRKWLDSRDFPTRSEWVRRKQACLYKIAEKLMYSMFDDMCENDNKLLFNITHRGLTEGWYKIGVFKEIYKNNLKEQLILAIVPDILERISKYYPVIYHSVPTRKKLTDTFNNPNKVKHEDIDIQECLAANNRLSGFYRRVKQSATH